MENQGHFQILVQNQKKPQQKKKTTTKKTLIPLMNKSQKLPIKYLQTECKNALIFNHL